IVESLELSFQFKGKDKLIKSSIDKVLNDFVVCKEPKDDLVLGIQWLWLRKAKIDLYGERILFYDRVISFYMNLSYDLENTEYPASQRDNTAYEFLSSSSSGSDSDSSSYKVIM
ncbi:3915_t:CDS:2, partial [Racocetra fulgida]